ncbi:glycosyltransferase [Plantibacter sp. RU18]|uniref:glycosyltransferase n=1 Tax=Plantibacter sp. RU18 TaxID=3158143 RepID=UPI003D35C3E0
MTAALLARSSMFVRRWGTPVDILTFDDYLHYPQLQESLIQAGVLAPGARLVNMWHWFRENSVLSSLDTVEQHVPLQTGPRIRDTDHAGRLMIRELLAEDGRIVATDRYRSNGTLLASDRRRTPESATENRKGILLYDIHGAPHLWFRTGGELYRYWLDRLSRQAPSFYVVDSKTSARFIAAYRRPWATTLHLVHGAHLDATGALTPDRRQTFQQLDAFDRIVFLSERQRAQASELPSAQQSHLAVIPNAVQPVPSSDQPRQRGQGVMLASLTPRKRVDHAIRAIAIASRTDDVTLDIYGEGPERPRLKALISELDVADRVCLRGAQPDAAEAFRTADFSLLTSQSEGLPLVLLESMGAGCVPISYDILYGPADLIRDGSNGYLLDSGDIAGLAAQIIDHRRDQDDRIEKLRGAAISVALHHDPVKLTARWATEMNAAQALTHARFTFSRRLRAALSRCLRRLRSHR